MISPIEKAKALTPWWMMEIRRYDGLEIHPVRDYHREKDLTGPLCEDPDNRETWCEPCDPHEAEFWSVYGHCKEGGIECFEDFGSEAEARAFARKLLEAYSHLNKHGLYG